MKIRIIIRNFFFSILVLVAFFGLFELGARIIGMIVPSFLNANGTNTSIREGIIISDPITNHKWIPNLDIVLNERGIPYHFFTNSQSWVENNDVKLEKDQDVYRIFYLGDSNTQGVVPYENSMVELVEKKLNEIYSPSGIHIEIINTGTSSYSTLLYYLLIKERILNYSPDLIVINIDMTDIPNDEMYRQRLSVDEHGYPTAVLPFAAKDRERFVLTPHGSIELSVFQRLSNFLSSKMLFYRLLSKLLSPAVNLSTEHLAWLPWHSEQSNSADWLSHDWNEEINQNVGFSMNIIKLIVKLVRDKQVKLMLTSVPHYPQYTGTWSSKPHDVLEETANELQIPYLNGYTALYSHIKDSKVETYYWASDPTHFNIQGNALWAEAQIQFLLDHRNALLPNVSMQSNTRPNP